jgi:hypothetical protein
VDSLVPLVACLYSTSFSSILGDCHHSFHCVFLERLKVAVKYFEETDGFYTFGVP